MLTAEQAVPILARMVRELRYDLDHATHRLRHTEQRALALEQHIRQQTLLRRDWYRERVRV